MVKKERISAEVAERFDRVVYKFNVFQKSPIDFGTGEPLYIHETHTLTAIGKNPGINVTDLAKELCVTKGAVSQVIGKLEKRGYLRKRKDFNDGKRVLLELEEKGNMVVEGHDRFHGEIYSKYLDDVSYGQFTVFKKILIRVEAFLDKKINKAT